jgi:hypothetical protein
MRKAAKQQSNLPNQQGLSSPPCCLCEVEERSSSRASLQPLLQRRLRSLPKGRRWSAALKEPSLLNFSCCEERAAKPLPLGRRMQLSSCFAPLWLLRLPLQGPKGAGRKTPPSFEGCEAFRGRFQGGTGKTAAQPFPP